MLTCFWRSSRTNAQPPTSKQIPHEVELPPPHGSLNYTPPSLPQPPSKLFSPPAQLSIIPETTSLHYHKYAEAEHSRHQGLFSLACTAYREAYRGVSDELDRISQEYIQLLHDSDAKKQDSPDFFIGSNGRKFSMTSVGDDDDDLPLDAPGLGFFRGQSSISQIIMSTPETVPESIKLITDPSEAYTKGISCSQSARYEEAIKYYKHAIFLDNTNPKYCNAIAFNYYLLEDMTKAIKWCNNILDFHSSYGPAHATLSYIYRYKASLAREEGRTVIAQKWNERAIKELLLSKKYEKNIIKSKELYKSYIELGAAFLEADNLEQANKYFHKATIFLNHKLEHKPKHYNDQDRVKEYAQYKKDLEYIAEFKARASATKDKIQSSIPHESASSTHSDNTNSASVINAVHAFKLGFSVSTLRKIQAEMKDAMDDMVRRDEVSVAIEENAYAKKIKLQKAEINSDPKLKEYYDAFRSMLSIAYASAQAVEGGQVALDTGSLLQQGFNMALGCIPLIGEALSTIAEIGEDLYNSAQIHKNSKLLLKLAATPGDLEEILTEVALDITLHPSKKDAILSFRSEPKSKGLLQKIIDKCKAIKSSVDKALDGGELYKTDHAKLGLEDAIHAIEQFLKYSAKLKTTCADKDEAVECLKHALISEEHWVVTTTDISAVVHTHVVDHSKAGHVVTDTTHTLLSHQTSYEEGSSVESPLQPAHVSATPIPLHGNIQYNQVSDI